MTINNQFPLGWNEQKVYKVIEHYENQSEDEAVVEDENLLETPTHTLMNIPLELVPIVRDLIVKYESSI